MCSPDDHPTPPIVPETDLERALLEAYRATDEAGRVILWREVLAKLGRRQSPEPEAGPHEGEASRS